MTKVLLKDIVIPKGTIFGPAPVKTTRGSDCFDAVFGLTKDSSGSIEYYIDDPALDEWFADMKG